jgi:excisionase family DNA binding protein
MAIASQTQTAEPHSEGGLITLDAAERELAAALASRLRHSDPRAVVLEIEGQPVALPEPMVEALTQLADQLGRGRALSLAVHRATLTPQQAANLINVSRPHLMKLVRAGKLYATKVGTHHRLALEEVLQYRAARDADFEAGMDELARLAED